LDRTSVLNQVLSGKIKSPIVIDCSSIFYSVIHQQASDDGAW